MRKQRKRPGRKKRPDAAHSKGDLQDSLPLVLDNNTTEVALVNQEERCWQDEYMPILEAARSRSLPSTTLIILEHAHILVSYR
jgi:hypothetical protein